MPDRELDYPERLQDWPEQPDDARTARLARNIMVARQYRCGLHCSGFDRLCGGGMVMASRAEQFALLAAEIEEAEQRLASLKRKARQYRPDSLLRYPELIDEIWDCQFEIAELEGILRP